MRLPPVIEYSDEEAENEATWREALASVRVDPASTMSPEDTMELEDTCIVVVARLICVKVIVELWLRKVEPSLTRSLAVTVVASETIVEVVMTRLATVIVVCCRSMLLLVLDSPPSNRMLAPPRPWMVPPFATVERAWATKDDDADDMVMVEPSSSAAETVTELPSPTVSTDAEWARRSRTTVMALLTRSRVVPPMSAPFVRVKVLLLLLKLPEVRARSAEDMVVREKDIVELWAVSTETVIVVSSSAIFEAEAMVRPEVNAMMPFVLRSSDALVKETGPEAVRVLPLCTCIRALAPATVRVDSKVTLWDATTTEPPSSVGTLRLECAANVMVDPAIVRNDPAPSKVALRAKEAEAPSENSKEESASRVNTAFSTVFSKVDAIRITVPWKLLMAPRFTYRSRLTVPPVVPALSSHLSTQLHVNTPAWAACALAMFRTPWVVVAVPVLSVSMQKE